MHKPIYHWQIVPLIVLVDSFKDPIQIFEKKPSVMFEN